MIMMEGTEAMPREPELVVVLVCIDVTVESEDDVEYVAVIGCVNVVAVCEVEELDIMLQVEGELDGL
jgi:hypothetical protein